MGFIRKQVHKICQYCPVYQTVQSHWILCLWTVAKLDLIRPRASASNFAVTSALNRGLDYRPPEISSNLNYSVFYAIVFSLPFSTCTNCSVLSGPKQRTDITFPVYIHIVKILIYDLSYDILTQSCSMHHTAGLNVCLLFQVSSVQCLPMMNCS